MMRAKCDMGIAALSQLLLFCSFLATVMGGAPYDVCEMRDGDCEECKPLSKLSPTALVRLSGEPQLVASAMAAQKILTSLSASNGSDIISFDDPKTGLHTSLFYFCCHNALDVAKLVVALKRMNWTSFVINYDTFWCNLDMKTRQTVYVHALPSNQTALFAWATLVEQAASAAGVVINHPRKSLFHMTLGRVTPTYPTDRAVEVLRGKEFGTHRLCSFEFEGFTIKADDC